MEELFTGLMLAMTAVMLVLLVASVTLAIHKSSLHDDLVAYGKVVVQLGDTPVECVKK